MTAAILLTLYAMENGFILNLKHESIEDKSRFQIKEQFKKQFTKKIVVLFSIIVKIGPMHET